MVYFTCLFSFCVALLAPADAAFSTAPIIFVPLDDRPVTLQLPLMLGDIAGRRILSPPREMIGHYLTPGDPDAIRAWMMSPATADAEAAVVSADMMMYGGLVASRTPEIATHTAIARLRDFSTFRGKYPRTTLDVFGTIMRLAPTGLPTLPSTINYWATADTVAALQQYANLHDPPQTAQEKESARTLRVKIGDPVLSAYLASRARNRDVDLFELRLVADGYFDRLVLGQDDAGPVGLHVRDVAALTRRADRLGLGTRAAIEPGADEIGMVLLAARFAHDIGWVPSIRVRYSRADAARINDPLEFAPIDVTISRLIHAVGACRVEENPDIDLFVKVVDTNTKDERTFLAAINDDVEHHVSAAVADVTFLNNPKPSKEQQQLTEELISGGIAGLIDAFASWNTTANTVGTALAEVVAVGAGKRSGEYNPMAHAQFMLNRYIDDYAFHQFVRPVLNQELRAESIDPTLLEPGIDVRVNRSNRALLWPYAVQLLKNIYPQYRDAGMTITLPWQRTFETQIGVRLI